MPWEQVEERPVLVPPKGENAESPPTEVPPPALGLVMPLSEHSSIVPPMPWEQVEERALVVPPVEESTTLPTQEVNDDLIAKILDQADLKHVAPSQSEAIPIVPDAQSSERPSPDHSSTEEPAPIRALLDDAVVRDAAALSHSPVSAAPPAVESAQTTDAMPSNPVVPTPVDAVSLEGFTTQREGDGQAQETVTTHPDVVHPIVQPTDSVEPTPTPAAEEKSKFSLFPAVLRLVGVTKDKPTETELPPMPPAVTEPTETSLLSDERVPGVEEIAPIAPASPIESPVPSTPIHLSNVEEAPVTASPVMEEPVAEQPEPEPGSDPGPEFEDHVADPMVAPVDHPLSSLNEQPGPNVIIASTGAVVETERPVEPSLPREVEIQPVDPVVDQGLQPEETADSPGSQAVERPVKKKKEKRRRSQGARPPATATAGRSAPVEERPQVEEVVSGRTGTAAIFPSPADHTPPPRVSVISEPIQPVASQRVMSVPPTEPRQTAQGLGRSAEAPKPKSSLNVGGILRRIWWRVTMFVQTCFATAHAVTVTIISLAALTIGVSVLAIGGLGVVWLGLEEKPNKAFQDLVSAVPQTTGEIKRTSYPQFLGIGASDAKDAMQAGVERYASQGSPAEFQACVGAVQSSSLEREAPAASTLRSWYREPIPSAAFSERAAAVKEWAREASAGLDKYRQWAGLPFEDGGYGQPSGPNCARILYLHRLQVAEGFAQGMDQGIERLESDLTLWRSVLRKARTLGVKMLAVAAINDDARIVSGLIMSPELDPRYLPRLTKVTVPLDQMELSLRWPMQHQFLMQKRDVDLALKNDREPDRPWYLMGIAAMPVPRQRVLNDYAEYYETLTKVAETSRETFTAPKLYSYVHAPAQGVLDYVSNPINNLLGVQTGPTWELYVGQVREADALLRLVSLQAWLRKTGQEGPGDVKTRLAKAGQNFYDPFTGLPLLVNSAKGRLYSVGRNGKDDDATPDLDVIVGLPGPGNVGTSPPSSSHSSKK